MELSRPYTAKVDLTGKVGYAVVGTTDTPDTNTPFVTLAGANAPAVGVIKDDGFGINTAVLVVRHGFAQIQAGATAIPAMAALKVDANGAFVPATAAGDVVVAYAQCPIAANGTGEACITAPSVIKIA